MSSDLKLDVALKLLKVAGHQIGDAHYVILIVSNICHCSARETIFSPEGDNYEFIYDLWAEHHKYRD
jgi:hypothetical protein